MSITIEQYFCHHDYDENYKCKKCQKTDYNPLHLRSVSLNLKNDDKKYSWNECVTSTDENEIKKIKITKRYIINIILCIISVVIAFYVLLKEYEETKYTKILIIKKRLDCLETKEECDNINNKGSLYSQKIDSFIFLSKEEVNNLKIMLSKTVLDDDISNDEVELISDQLKVLEVKYQKEIQDEKNKRNKSIKEKVIEELKNI